MNRIEFVEELKKLNIDLSPKQEDQFYTYAALLKEWNEKMNLTGITEENEVLQMHFYDSIVPFARASLTQGNFLDVGAGAGFPSVPCAIAFPSLQVTIVEPLQKRCVFLHEVIKVLQLENIQIINVRAEDYAKEKREYFDIVSARAVANLPMLCELCLPLVKVGGYFVAMKGSSGKEEHTAATKALQVLGGTLESMQEEHVGEHTHINIVYKKTKKTPPAYPRAFAKIKKNPL